ncbi:restriction endonuclease subunit S [Bacteroides fragilis]|uniref:Restriction endonuclease subunit S n=2 Tax=Bacteroides fragilis TaxID=817 RepID=A0A642HD05_BACFG|nr:restriction endonuclease subunit S [Bacteroides fragilis]KAA4799414.1 restriction endonuclease subunit S [Bacteroides fragilis]KAA4801561.1 restriction endonuclease subunit S [Bacteroides fragilis]KAA4816786.1 restriction endonuclease subunit S [Bacteroides fragilis]KAA4851345.1 restriction endonuclease subunit S [Bacteroides fragilis]
MRNFAPQMEKDMQSYRLSDLVKIKNGKDHKMLSNGKYPVLGSGGIMRYVDKFLYDKPSVLLPRKGTLDNIQYCDMPFWTVDTLYYTEVNTNLANPYYLYRYLSLLDLSNLDSGTGVPSMTFDNYYGLKIFLPNIEKQTKIAQILQTLDKKITINRQINQNLEAMAKLLYDYWFVQFDFLNEEGKPYKSNGGEMLWNDKLKRNIPVGWHCGNLFEIAVFTNGLACQKFRPKDDEVPLPVIKIREMHDGISVDTEEVTSNIPESVKVYNGDVLFSWSASLEVMLWAYGLGGLNQHIFKVTSANDFPKSFYYFQLLDYVDVFKKMAEARKTTMGHITQDHLQQSTIAIPDNKDIADKFEELISPIFRQIVKLQEEISNLIKQRDELLPLLMNGQITIE